MTATLRNAGAVTCSVSQGADRGFSISSGSQTLWASGCSTSPAGHDGPSLCPLYVQVLSLAPGESKTRSQAWSQQRDAAGSAPVAQVPPGTYRASQVWGGVTATAGFTIH